MSVVYSSLVLEVTRRCNMQCEHCLRGEAQSMNMSDKVIHSLMSRVDHIPHVTFSGGEPTLNVHAIRKFYEYMRWRNVEVGSFYVVTNGKIASRSLVSVLNDMYDLCTDRDEEMCRLAVSQDYYHERYDPKTGLKRLPSIYQDLPYYRPEDKKDINPKYIINEGRAYWNGIGMVNREAEGWEVSYCAGEFYIQNTIYISANGNINLGCDFSFDRCDEEAIGNILDDKMLEDHIPYEVRQAAIKEQEARRV